MATNNDAALPAGLERAQVNPAQQPAPQPLPIDPNTNDPLGIFNDDEKKLKYDTILAIMDIRDTVSCSMVAAARTIVD
jgi:hypothetical protein